MLSLDIWAEILVRLPAEYLIRFRAVSKGWRAVINVRVHTNKNHQQFSRSSSSNIIIRHCPPRIGHVPRYFSFDLQALNFANGPQPIAVTPLVGGLSHSSRRKVGSCNGLMLVGNNPCLVIWNPFTHEVLVLPQREEEFKCRRAVFGLGYDYTTDDYKAVAICCVLIGHDPGSVHPTHVYSLKSDSWRQIMNFPYSSSGPIGPGVYACGALFWLAITCDKIIALDLGTEKYRLLQMPPPPWSGRKISTKDFLDVLGGCLTLTRSCSIGKKYTLDVWVMKKEEDETWTKLLSIGPKQLHMGGNLRPVAYTGKDKTQVFLHDCSFRFFLYDLVTNSVKRVFIHGLTGNLYAQLFPATLFRLRDHCGRVERLRSRASMMIMKDPKLMFCVRDPKHWVDYDPHDDAYLTSLSYSLDERETDSEGCNVHHPLEL